MINKYLLDFAKLLIRIEAKLCEGKSTYIYLYIIYNKMYGFVGNMEHEIIGTGRSVKAPGSYSEI